MLSRWEEQAAQAAQGIARHGLSPAASNKVCTSPAVLLSWYFVVSSPLSPANN